MGNKMTNNNSTSKRILLTVGLVLIAGMTFYTLFTETKIGLLFTLFILTGAGFLFTPRSNKPLKILFSIQIVIIALILTFTISGFHL